MDIGIGIGLFLGLILGFLVGAAALGDQHPVLVSSRGVVAECEKSLPRDKVCGLVLSAKVVEE